MVVFLLYAPGMAGVAVLEVKKEVVARIIAFDWEIVLQCPMMIHDVNNKQLVFCSNSNILRKIPLGCVTICSIP